MSMRLPAVIVLAASFMVGSLALSENLRPTERVAATREKIDLEQLFPESFGDWKAMPAVRPLLPDPVGQAVIDATYSQTVARGYVNSRGEMVMLSVAYGDDQNSEATAAHRPEFCYTGHGFDVSDQGLGTVDLPGQALTVRRLLGVRGAHREPISYWVTLDEKATLPGLGRKLAQLEYGLIKRQIADGMLVRLSSAGGDLQANYALHDRFLRELYGQFPNAFRGRVFGS